MLKSSEKIKGREEDLQPINLSDTFRVNVRVIKLEATSCASFMEQRTSVKYSCDTRRIDRTFRGEINSSRTAQVAVRLPSVPSGSWLINQDNKLIDQVNITRH